MDGIGKTSLLTAAMRAQESKRSETDGRLFNDPYAEALAGAEGMELMRKGIEASGDQPAIAIRTKYMDDKVLEGVKQGAKQIVILACGMDTRAFRLDLPAGTKVFEVDHKEVLQYKQEKLGNAKPKSERKTLAVDLRDDWKTQLLNSGFQTGVKTIWMVEGLLMYLNESDVTGLFQKISSVASSGDTVLFDILSRTLLEAPMMKGQLQFLESIGAPWKFGVNEPEDFMKKFGWDASVTQTGEYIPSRWPFPTAPRNIPNVPRGFLVQAKKI